MTTTRQKKEEIIKDLKENLKKAKLIIFVNFHGLNVSAATQLRRLLGNIGARYLVAKKTLIKKALESFGLEGEILNLEGEVAMAFCEQDPILSAKAIEQFAKKNKAIKILGGVFENKYIGQKSVIMLANVPPREVLLGQFVHVINAPIQGLVVTLNGVMRNFVNVLNQIKNVKT